MNGQTRRSFVRATSFLGIGGLCTIGVPAFAGTSLTIPQTSMHLSRRTARTLNDGRQIIVARSWEVRFSPQGRGVAVMGQQVSCSVETPAALEPLAKIERNRSTAKMWPILLSETGAIVAAGDYTIDEDVSRAVKIAEDIIASRNDDVAVEARHLRNLAQMQKAGSGLLDQLPPDLFFPAGKPYELTRQISLPGGETGEFFVAYSANPDPDNGWLKSATRRIETRLGESVRTATEDWVMRPA